MPVPFLRIFYSTTNIAAFCPEMSADGRYVFSRRRNGLVDLISPVTCGICLRYDVQLTTAIIASNSFAATGSPWWRY